MRFQDVALSQLVTLSLVVKPRRFLVVETLRSKVTRVSCSSFGFFKGFPLFVELLPQCTSSSRRRLRSFCWAASDRDALFDNGGLANSTEALTSKF